MTEGSGGVGGGGGGGGREIALWENPTWAFSNSENSGGSGEKSGKKVQGCSSNSPAEMRVGEAAPPGKKRGREGGSKNGKGVEGEGKEEGKEGESDHEVHIWTERERRKKMRNMFANLHALLPQLPDKADKSTIVDEAINYIKTLSLTLQKLQRKKMERVQGTAGFGFDPSMINSQKVSFNSREAFLADQGSSSNPAIAAASASNPLPLLQYPVNFETWTSPNVILNICDDEAQICVCSPRRPGLFTLICCVLEKYKIEVVSAHISSDCRRSIFMFQAHVRQTVNALPFDQVAGAPDQFQVAASPVEDIYKQATGEIMFWVTP